MSAQQRLGRRGVLQTAWSVLLTLVFVPLAFWGADPSDVWQGVLSADWKWVAAAFLLFALTTLAKTLRWLAFFHGGVSFSALFAALTVGQVANFLLPARLGDVARVLVLRRRAGERAALVAGTVGAEKLLDLLALVALCALTFPLFHPPAWLWDPAARIAVLLASALVAFGVAVWHRASVRRLVVWLFDRSGRRPAASLRGQANLLWGGFAPLLRRENWLILIPLTVLILALMVATNEAIFRAMHLPESWLLSAVLLVILQIGIAVPSTPGKIGVFQALVALGLSLGGIAREDAVGYGILLYAVIVAGQAALAAPFAVQEAARLRAAPRGALTR